MLVTVVATLASRNLAIGVVLGVLAAMVIFARRVAHFAEVTSVLDLEGTTRIYYAHGELFFASGNDLVYQFDYSFLRRRPRRNHHQVRVPREARRHRRAEHGKCRLP